MSNRKVITLRERVVCPTCSKDVADFNNPGSKREAVMDSERILYDTYDCFRVVKRNQPGAENLRSEKVYVKYFSPQSELAKHYGSRRELSVDF
jgi:hypothetical protein